MDDHPANREAFWTAMDRLSIALTITLTEERAAVYWDALCDLRLEDVVFACQHAARHWQVTEHERVFPVPARLREYALLSRDNRVRETTAAARSEARRAEKALIAQWSEIPDEVGLAAIRKILTKLGDDMTMTHPVYQHPSTDNPEKRKAELLEQALLAQLDRNGQEDA